jgi:hypothetical protein
MFMKDDKSGFLYESSDLARPDSRHPNHIIEHLENQHGFEKNPPQGHPH